MPIEPLANIFVEGLRIVCILGDLPHERTEPQQILVNLKAQTDISRVAASDNLQDSIDYVAMAALATRIAEQGRFHLVETLISAMAKSILDQWPSIVSISIRVEKSNCIPTAQACGVEYTLRK